MALTPLMLMAGQGLAEDTALEINSEMQAAFTAYTSIPFLTTFTDIVTFVAANVTVCTTNSVPDGEGGYEDITTCTNGFPASFVNTLTHILDDTMPVLTNVIPTSSGISTTYFSDFINHHSTNILGSGSNSVFIGHLLSVYGFTQTANEYINTAVNGADLGAQTYTDMDALITGNISSVNKFTTAFGQDLINTGNLYDFSDLSKFGSPELLMRKLSSANLLTTIATELEDAGIDIVAMQQALIDNPDKPMLLKTQKKCYNAFTNVNGHDLESILLVLGIKTAELTTLADTFDIIKMFPSSYSTLTSLNNGVLENIFVGTDLSPYVAAFKTDMTAIMSEVVAKSNYALAISLQQIKNVHDSDAKTIGEQAQSLETNQGLSELDSLVEPVPADVIEYYQSTMGQGSGINGTYYITDGVGTAAGLPHIENFTLITNIINQFAADGDLDEIELIFTVIENLANGVYDTDGYQQEIPLYDEFNDPTGEFEYRPYEVEIPAGTPGAGLYDNKELAISNGIEPALEVEVTILEANNPTETATANDAYQSSIDHTLLELQTLQDADIRFPVTYTSFDAPANWFGMQPSKERALNFAANLHTYGKETSKGHLVEILEGVANDSRGGQAIIAAMREGRNLAKLEDAGIQADNKIDNTPEEVLPGNISPSTY